jgi:hypothetical protein
MSGKRILTAHLLQASVLLLFSFFISCKEDEDNDNHKPVADYSYMDEIDKYTFSNASEDEDGDILAFHWLSDCNDVRFDNSYSEEPSFYLFESDAPTQISITLIASDGNLSDSVTQSITLPKTTTDRLYGLGKETKEVKSNNVSYNWYFDQGNTGQHSGNNCGPSSVTMAIKWADENFSKTPEDARNTYRSGGGWWYTDDIINYLNLYNIHNETIELPDIDALQSEIDAGNIAILCLDMYYIRDEENTRWHIDKFYNASVQGWGHFIVIKGFREVDDEVYYESYDPYSFEVKYKNDTLKGINRYYRGEDLNKAVSDWWPYAIVISKTALKNNRGIDTRTIIHKPGL